MFHIKYKYKTLFHGCCHHIYLSFTVFTVVFLWDTACSETLEVFMVSMLREELWQECSDVLGQTVHAAWLGGGLRVLNRGPVGYTRGLSLWFDKNFPEIHNVKALNSLHMSQVSLSNQVLPLDHPQRGIPHRSPLLSPEGAVELPETLGKPQSLTEGRSERSYSDLTTV